MMRSAFRCAASGKPELVACSRLRALRRVSNQLGLSLGRTARDPAVSVTGRAHLPLQLPMRTPSHFIMLAIAHWPRLSMLWPK